MNDFGKIQLRLPFDHTVIGYMIARNRQFVAWSRSHPLHPFGTHEIMPSGNCEQGQYFEKNTEALADLSQRANPLT